ncbi:alpha/beta-hydrolase [Peniophora sp. CONT]|nr:alpha/beta-hydrolase [Peniophora sp. CONT]
MSVPPPLPLSQRLDMVPAMVSVLVAALYTAAQGPFRGSEGAATFDRHMQNGITRQLAGRMSIPQLQFIRGTTAATFEKWAKANPEVHTHSEAVAEGTAIHWLGDKDADKILLHLHGGGYILPLSVGHLALMNGLRQRVSQATGATVAVAFVEYSLAPIKPYPTQVREAHAGLQHLLSQGVAPSKIILSGDSAGAHVVLCLIAHLLHPHPALPAPLRPSTPFGGLLLISPRVSNSTTAASFSQNSHRDTLTRETFESWITNFRANGPVTTSEGLAKDGFYTEPVQAPSDWWDGLSDLIAKEVFVSAGEHECMRDDIVKFAENWKGLPGMNVVLEIEEKGIHDSPLMDASRPPSDLVKAIEAWLKIRVEAS